MARPSREPLAPSALVPAVLRLVRGHDAEAAAVLASRLGLDADAIELDEVPVSDATIQDALALAAASLGEPHLALRLPRVLPLRRYGLAELAARSSATLRDGLTRLARYAALIHPALVCVLEEEGDEARWIQRAPGRARGIGMHAEDYALAYVLATVRQETGRDLSLVRARFVHARPRDLAPLHGFFGTRELEFGGEESLLVMPRAQLDLPMVHGDPRLLVTAEELAEVALRAQPRATEIAALVASRVESLLESGATIGAVARALHMSPRTLQRRLDDEAASFSEVVDGVRQRLARAWLADEARSLTEIAFALGFSDLATFSRAFKRWTGKPPGQWRRS
jgi:AraC-like DNA-binding protein